MRHSRAHFSEFPAWVESCGVAFCDQHPALIAYAGAGMIRAAFAIALCDHAIQEVAANQYLVDSQQQEGLYYLTSYGIESGLPQCSCRTYRFYAETHGMPICHHIFAVAFYREALTADQEFERGYDAMGQTSSGEVIAHDATTQQDGRLSGLSQEVAR